MPDLLRRGAFIGYFLHGKFVRGQVGQHQADNDYPKWLRVVRYGRSDGIVKQQNVYPVVKLWLK